MRPFRVGSESDELQAEGRMVQADLSVATVKGHLCPSHRLRPVPSFNPPLQFRRLHSDSMQPTRRPAARISILRPEKSPFRTLAVSPDRRQIAMVLNKDRKQQIWFRALDVILPLTRFADDGCRRNHHHPARQPHFEDQRNLHRCSHNGGSELARRNNRIEGCGPDQSQA